MLNVMVSEERSDDGETEREREMDEDEGREREERICVERVKGPDLNTGKGNGPNPKQPSQGAQTLSLPRSGPPITQPIHAAMSAATRRTNCHMHMYRILQLYHRIPPPIHSLPPYVAHDAPSGSLLRFICRSRSSEHPRTTLELIRTPPAHR
jgi:hypothetical protein